MNFHNVSADHGVFEASTFSQCPEHAIENIRFHPTAKALEDRIPVAEDLGQFPPLRSRSYDPQHALHEQPCIAACLAKLVGNPERQQTLEHSTRFSKLSPISATFSRLTNAGISFANPGMDQVKGSML